MDFKDFAERIIPHIDTIRKEIGSTDNDEFVFITLRKNGYVDVTSRGFDGYSIYRAANWIGGYEIQKDMDTVMTIACTHKEDAES